MLRILAPLLFLALGTPALADLRPVPRPPGVAAFAGATDLAPRISPRPLPSARIVPSVLRISAVPERVARFLALEPVGAGSNPVAVDPPLRAAVAARRMVVTTSAANAPAMPDAAGAVRAAFVLVPGPTLVPRARPARVQATPVALGPRLRPAPRPTLAVPEAPVPELAVVSPRPAPRPDDLRRRPAKAAAPDAVPEAAIIKTAAVRVKPGEALVKPKKGSLCGDRRIRGAALAPIPAQIKGCGIAEPVRVTEVDGVRLSPAATMDCTTARALTSWVEDALKPAAGKRGVAALQVAAGYACRSRNNVRGARISEHGRGKAIDVMAIVLADGQVIDVLRDYRRDAGKFLRAAHKSACGVFGTTLGPGSDGYHENNLHYDTASYRSGPYCR
ncbi:MAG: extensin family protein [Gemmobacter sp.]